MFISWLRHFIKTRNPTHLILYHWREEITRYFL